VPAVSLQLLSQWWQSGQRDEKCQQKYQQTPLVVEHRDESNTRSKANACGRREKLAFMPFRLLKKQGCFFNTFGASLKP
jgi:hypothetical protein